MKKKATGLISVPMSNVPGAEDVEINTMRDEDIEAANHGGFNQMEVGDFAKDLEFVTLIDSKSANSTTKIIEVNKNMEKELKKLNSALNSLGYNNLIKIAIITNAMKINKIYMHKTGGYAVKCSVAYQDGGNWSNDVEVVATLIWTAAETGTAMVNEKNNSYGASPHKLGDEITFEDNPDDDIWQEVTCYDLAKLGGAFADGQCATEVEAIKTSGASGEYDLTDLQTAISGDVNVYKKIFKLSSGAYVGFPNTDEIRTKTIKGDIRNVSITGNPIVAKDMYDRVVRDTAKSQVGTY